MYTNVKLGAWANALKGYTECGASGGSIGLMSAVVAEMKYPNGAMQGAYFPLEIEIVDQGSTAYGSLWGASAGFMYLAITGTATGFDTSGMFMRVTGLTAGAAKCLSLNTQTLRCYIGTSARYLLLSQIENGIGLGLTGTPQAVTFDGTKQIACYTTCASTNAGTSHEPQLFNNVLTGAGQVGGRFRINMSTNVSLGAWANAFKATVECNAVGGATGLLSVANLEITMPTTGIAGTTACLEMNIGYGATCGALQKPAFIVVATSGTAATDFDTYGDFLKIGGMTGAAGKVLSATTQTLRVGTGALHATKRYLFMSQYEDTISIGLTGSKKTLVTGVPEIAVWSTSALTSGTQDVVKIDYTHATGGTTGYVKGIRCTMTCNVISPGSFNAIKGIIDYQTNGYPHGDCAPMSSELTMPDSTATRGSFTAYEAQIGCGASSVWNSAGPASFVRCKVNGTKTHWDAYGYFIDFQGVDEGNGKMIDSTGGDLASTGGIRCLMGTTPIWLLYTTSAPA